MSATADSTSDSASAAVRHLLLGTAGHIDHGKTSLVRALTGIDTDRLPQEKARGMTIELGFAPLETERCRFGIVDVPGHERFVRTMVAGATGIDLALLVVAADDGVMPQTVEHADILDLLGVRAGAVAISKADLVDADRVEAVRGQVADLLAGTGLADAPMVAVSSETGQGLDALRAALAAQADRVQARRVSSVFRLGIDRVFTIHGRGTVVTGSVLSGQVQKDTQLELLPRQLRCRVREVQTHGQATAQVGPGQRAALNLVNVDRAMVERGQELATPGCLLPTRYVAARYRHLAGAGRPLRSHTRVRLAMSTHETMAVCVVLDAGKAAVAPGEAAMVQFRMSEPIVCAYGQPFIVREETASRTLGGGTVLHAARRRLSPRQTADVAGLQTLHTGDAQTRVAEVLRSAGFSAVDAGPVAAAAAVEPEEVAEILGALEADGTLRRLAGVARPLHAGALAALVARAQRWLEGYHRRRPNDPGCLADAFTGWLARRTDKALARALAGWMSDEGAIRRQGRYVCHPTFRPALSPQDAELLAAIVEEVRDGRFQPPAIAALRCAARHPKDKVQRLVELAKSEGTLVGIDETVMLHGERYDEMKRIVRDTIESNGAATVSQLRQALDSTRKFVVPLLEHLDKVGFTRRQGNERVLAR